MEGLKSNKEIGMNSRRHFLKTLAAGATASYISLPSCISKNGPTKITILHTNDVHSQIDPFPENHAKYPGQGGYARRAALIKQVRKTEEHVLLLDSGDIFQGTPYFNFYKGELEIKLMNDMAYDASTIGNHEFDNGITELAKQMKKAEFPFVVSNYNLEKTNLSGLTQPYKIIQKGAIKIGIIGLCIDLNGLASPKNCISVDYLDPIAEGDKIAAHLKNNEHCDYVIALSHLGYHYKNDKVSDIVVGKNTQNIDLILGGHTHTFLEEPTCIKNKLNKNVYINQTGWGGIKLGRIDILFDQKNQANKMAYCSQL